MCLGGQEHLNDPAQRLGMSVSRHPVTVWTIGDVPQWSKSLGYPILVAREVSLRGIPVLAVKRGHTDPARLLVRPILRCSATGEIPEECSQW